MIFLESSILINSLLPGSLTQAWLYFSTSMSSQLGSDSQGASTTRCLVETTDSNSEDENSELGLTDTTGLSTTKRLWGL